MATIKAGDYVFNVSPDVSTDYSAQFAFTSNVDLTLNFQGMRVGLLYEESGLEYRGIEFVDTNGDIKRVYLSNVPTALADEYDTNGWLNGYDRSYNLAQEEQVETNFATWVDENTTLATKKNYARLYVGDVVEKIGTRAFKLLFAETPQEPQKDVIGTWVMNEKITPLDTTADIGCMIGGNIVFPNLNFGGVDYVGYSDLIHIAPDGSFTMHLTSTDPEQSYVELPNTVTIYDGSAKTWNYESARTFIINSVDKSMTTDDAYEWLIATATKQEDSVLGTWVFNDVLTGDTLGNYGFDVIFSYTDNNGLLHEAYSLFTSPIKAGQYDTVNKYVMGYEETVEAGDIAYQVYEWYVDGSRSYWSEDYYKTITITGGQDVNNADFIAWLKANANKVEDESIIGTWVLDENLSYLLDNGIGFAEGEAFGYARRSKTETEELPIRGIGRSSSGSLPIEFYDNRVTDNSVRNSYYAIMNDNTGGTYDGLDYEYIKCVFPYYTGGFFYLVSKTSEMGVTLRTIKILKDVLNESQKEWLEANATKQ